MTLELYVLFGLCCSFILVCIVPAIKINGAPKYWIIFFVLAGQSMITMALLPTGIDWSWKLILIGTGFATLCLFFLKARRWPGKLIINNEDDVPTEVEIPVVTCERSDQ